MRTPRPVSAVFLLACATALAACSNEGSVVPLPPGCAAPDASPTPIATVAPVAATAAQLVEAMGMPPGLFPPPFLSGEPEQAAVFPGLGTAVPTEGATFAWLSTGVAGAGTPSALVSTAGTLIGTSFGNAACDGVNTYDCVELDYTFVVPPDDHAVRFDFRFFTTEYPEFLGANFNDTFTVALLSSSFQFDDVSFDEQGRKIDVNSDFFLSNEVVTCPDLVGTGFDVDDPANPGSCHGGATGLLGTIAPVAPGERVTLKFKLHDEGDGYLDSAVMLDHLETTPDAIATPATSNCD